MNFDEFVENNRFGITESEALNHNVLVFAFVGDAVFSLYVRDMLASHSTEKAGLLHTKSSKFVRASFQAKLIDILFENLNEREHRVVNTARNLKTHNIAKNSSIEEYKKATSFESLLGYLYLTRQNDRLSQILKECNKYMVLNKE